MVSQNDLIRLYNEKIKHIEDQKKLKMQKKDKTVEDYEQGRFKRGTINNLLFDFHPALSFLITELII